MLWLRDRLIKHLVCAKITSRYLSTTARQLARVTIMILVLSTEYDFYDMHLLVGLDGKSHHLIADAANPLPAKP